MSYTPAVCQPQEMAQVVGLGGAGSEVKGARELSLSADLKLPVAAS